MKLFSSLTSFISGCSARKTLFRNDPLEFIQKIIFIWQIQLFCFKKSTARDHECPSASQ